MVFYLTNCAFPNGGMATANRIRHLCRAFVAGGVAVRVLVPFSSSGKIEKMVVDGISYESLCALPTSRIKRCISIWVLYPWRAFRCLCKARRESPVLLYSYVASVEMMTIHWAMSRLLRCPLAAEECEYPFSVLLHASKLRQWYESRVVPRFYDGIVCISHALQDYFAPRIRKCCESIYVPMTVDCDSFATAKGRPFFDFEYIAYTGTMRREGGGVDVLVRAFALVAERHPELHLVLIGDGDAALQRKFEALAGAHADRIHCIFGGKVPREEMPRYIANAKILAMLPLPTLQQQGCFPTKLGEYLASGVPTVITKVGNPVQYLTGGENVFYVPPSDEKAAASRFEEILVDYPQAQAVGRNGQRFARENFHYENFSMPLADWYRQLAEGKA